LLSAAKDPGTAHTARTLSPCPAFPVKPPIHLKNANPQ
jgi:hypothetical protein